MTLGILKITARELQKGDPRVPVVEVINVDFYVEDTHVDLFLDSYPVNRSWIRKENMMTKIAIR